MVALGALLQLRVDVHRHLRVGVPDLVHDPLDVEVVREQGDRDVGAPQRVRCGAWQRRQASRDELLGRTLGGFADDLTHALAVHPLAAEVRDQVVVRSRRDSHAAQAIEVLDDGLDQVEGHLHLADAGLGLGVGDAEACAVGVVQAHLADLDVAQLACADARASQDLDHDTPSDIAATDLQAESREVVVDRRLGQSQLLGDLGRPPALHEELSDHRGGQPQLAGSGDLSERDVLLGGRVDQGRELVDLDVHIREGQGITAEHSSVLIGGWQTDRENAYVSLSRARERTDIYLSREDLGEEGLNAGAIQRLGELTARSNAQEATLTRDLAERESPAPDRHTERAPLGQSRERVAADDIHVASLDHGLTPQMDIPELQYEHQGLIEPAEHQIDQAADAGPDPYIERVIQ